MARKKNEVKAKEPVKLRFKKLSNANQSYLLYIWTSITKERGIMSSSSSTSPRNVSLKTVIRTESLCAWPIVSRHNGSLIFRTRFMVSV